MLSVKKGAKKRCCYGICRSDTRSKSFSEYLYYFISFPKPCLEYRRKLIKSTRQTHIKNCPKCVKCDLWVKRCRRGDGRFQLIDHVNKDTYICSLHFEGESGPTTEHPDPISCVKKVSCNQVRVARTCLAEKYKQTQGGMNQSITYLNHHVESMDCKEDVKNVIIDDGYDPVTSASVLSHDIKSEFISCDEDNETLRDLVIEDYVLTSDSHIENERKAFALSHDVKTEFISCNEDNETLRDLVIEDYVLTSTDSHIENEKKASALSHDVKTEFISCNEDNETLRDLVIEDYVLISTDSHIENKASASITSNQGVQTDLKKFTSKRTQVKIRKRSAMSNFEDSIKTNKKKCKFYTSLEYQEIVILHNYVNPECKNIADEIRQRKGNVKKSNNCHQKLTSIQQLILVLIRLRVGILVEDMAYRFEISTGLVSKTIKTWIQFLYDRFSCNLKPFMFPSKKNIAETLPTTFKSSENIRVIVDCMEFQCQSPSNFEHQGNFYSRTVYKALIGCTPNGSVCFVSDVYEGNISDREIFIKSNISEHLEPGDLVLAGRGFNVRDR